MIKIRIKVTVKVMIIKLRIKIMIKFIGLRWLPHPMKWQQIKFRDEENIDTTFL